MPLAEEDAGCKRRDRLWGWTGLFFFGEHATVDNARGFVASRSPGGQARASLDRARCWRGHSH
jgi:hypothetical protein